MQDKESDLIKASISGSSTDSEKVRRRVPGETKVIPRKGQTDCIKVHVLEKDPQNDVSHKHDVFSRFFYKRGI